MHPKEISSHWAAGHPDINSIGLTIYAQFERRTPGCRAWSEHPEQACMADRVQRLFPGPWWCLLCPLNGTGYGYGR